MRRRARFTLVHGFVVSLALHSAVAIPFFTQRLVPRPDEPPILVIDLQNIIEDEQTEQKVLEQVKGTTEPEKTVEKPTPVQDKPPPEPQPERQPDAEPVVTVPSPKPQVVCPGKDQQNVVGTDQNQVARTVRTEQQEDDALSAYVKVLSKKIRSNLVYPPDGRRASAVVAFTILADGKLRPDSLKIAESSGQPKLDASALQTIRASTPFPPPPKELSVAIIVDFDRKR
jgi:protein TonB